MNVYVRRNEAGEIELVSSHPYADENGLSSEELPADHPEVVAFLTQKAVELQ